MDSSKFESEEENYVLMANSEEIAASAEKVPNSAFDFDTDNISKWRLFIK